MMPCLLTYCMMMPDHVCFAEYAESSCETSGRVAHAARVVNRDDGATHIAPAIYYSGCMLYVARGLTRHLIVFDVANAV